jgi:maltose alpha-D-glucosyltransferase/alpha-amylase
MHRALAEGTHTPEFKPEEYSLHYQRSLYSSMQGLVRETFHNFSKRTEEVPSYMKEELEAFSGTKNSLLRLLRRIYAKKLDILKTRIHGSFTLKKLLMTGKDIVIQDFGGNPLRSFSERRLKRSPIRDLADMILSFHYTAYEGFFLNQHLPSDMESRLPFAELWANQMSGFFMHAYLQEIRGTPLVPSNREDLEVVLHNFLLEKSLLMLNRELDERPDYVVVPLRIIKPLIGLKPVPVEAIQET